MKKRLLLGAVPLALLAGLVLCAEDKYTAKVPGGLALSEFKGYESWQTISAVNTGRCSR